MERNYNNNKKICPYFRQGTCKYKNDGDCDGRHAFCKSGNDCSFPNCKFMHPYDSGFKKTCKKSYFLCKYKSDCQFKQHPNQNYIYNDNENEQEKIYHDDKYENNKNDQDEIVKKYKQLNRDSSSSFSSVIRKEKRFVDEKNDIDDDDNQEKLEHMKKEMEQMLHENMQQFKEHFEKRMNDVLNGIKIYHNDEK